MKGQITAKRRLSPSDCFLLLPGWRIMSLMFGADA